MRFFSPSASWNVPADDLGIDRSTAVADWPRRLVRSGGGPLAEAQRFDLKFRDYSVPTYDAAKATVRVKAYQCVWSQNEQTFGNVPIGTSIPWNPAWRPGSGQDRILAIVDYSTGEAWYLWGVGETGCWDWLGPNNRAGWATTSTKGKLCLAGLVYQPNIWAATDRPRPADLPPNVPWFGTVNARGMGIDKLALVVRAWEVANGSVDHAVPFTISNPATTPVRFRRPATKLEWARGLDPNRVNVMPVDQRLPSGARFRVRKTRAEVEAWAKARNFGTPELTRTMTIVGWALCRYGGIVAETGKWGIGIETDGLMEPGAAAIWKANGIVDDSATNPMMGANLLAGLIDEASLEVVAEPYVFAA